MNKLKAFWALLTETYSAWRKDYAMLLAGALSFFSIFSIVPILILAIALSGYFWGEERANQEILKQIGVLLSPRMAEATRKLLDAARHSGAGLASLFSGGVLVILASRVFIHLRSALNLLWDVEKHKRSGFVISLKNNLASVALMTGAIFYIFIFFFFDTGFQIAHSAFLDQFPQIEEILKVLPISFITYFLQVAFSFALLYRFVPQTKVKWEDVWLGAIVTSLLFALGRYGITMYFNVSDIASFYGAASSIVILLLWIYVSALIFLFGARFTCVYAHQYGSRARGKR